ncbi:hypothetical protein [Yersinia enterocolitica]|uniref:hypothetical protein n=1 Tax=Yersinia enterocolitica TaxID=630 RepID=UPI003D7B1C1D
MQKIYIMLKRMNRSMRKVTDGVPLSTAFKLSDMVLKLGGTLLTAGCIGLALTNDTVTASEALYLIGVGVFVSWHGFMLDTHLSKRQEKSNES